MTEIKRLHSLDAARGIAALAVVVWHWQHMYSIGGGKLEDRSIQPFYDLLFPLYHAGWLAVEFFFTLSGFVFFWLYGQRIANAGLSFIPFWIARLSRLYPLHFLTLLVVGGLQLVLLTSGHNSFIYGGTNLSNFGLNLLFLQYFSEGSGFNFNGPEWSIGVEILLYFMFFLYCRLVRPNWVLPLLLCVGIGIWAMGPAWALGRGIIGFFLGGLAYEAWRHLRDRLDAKTIATVLVGLALAGWVYSVVEIRTHWLAALLNGIDNRGYYWVEMALRLLLVPLTVLALALNESAGARFWRRLSPIGDLTYALYLWHFPLQLAIAVAVTLAGLPLAPFQSPLGMLGFMAVLILLSIASYHWIERPAQAWIRDWYAGRSKVVEKVA